MVHKKGIHKEVRLNNTSRKGTYIYIKHPGKKPKYYKKKPGLTHEDYEYLYTRKIYDKRGGITRSKIQKEQKFENIVRQYPSIEASLGNGYAEHTIQTYNTLSTQQIKRAYNQLLATTNTANQQPIVQDQQLIQLLTRNENLEKWKQRVLYEVTLFNQEGLILNTINNTKTKTLNDIQKELLPKVRLGTDYDTWYKNNEEIRKSGYVIHQGNTRKGRINKVTIKMVFRKAR